MYSFGSALATSSSSSSSSSGQGGGVGGGGGRGGGGRSNNVIPRKVGVENYITHNGDFEFFRVKDKYYDVEVLQSWLEKVLETPMPATVDSGEFCSLSLFV